MKGRRLRAEHDPHYGKSAYARIPNDAYFTRDERCAPALLGLLPQLRGQRIWEPAAGGYDLAEDLRAGGTGPVVCSDILRYRPAPEGLAELTLGSFFDFQRPPRGVRVICTNPPNKFSYPFAEHALRLMRVVRGLVALLVPIAWDAAPGRTHLLEGHPAFALKIVLTFRPWWFERRDSQPREFWQWLVWDWSRRPGPAPVRYA